MSYWRGLGALRLRNPPLKWGSSPRPSPQRVLVLKPQIAVAALQRPRGIWSGDDNNPNRRFLDKVTRDPNATFNGTKDGPRFLTALRQYDDLLDLVFRLANPKEFGLKLLRESLTHLGDREGLNQHVVPFLAVLGSDTLAAATCRRPLLQVLEGCYRVPGLLDCMHDALAQDAIAEPAPIGWFLLTLASQVEAVRKDEQVLAMAVLLEQCPGAAGKAGAELRVVLAGSQSASSMSDTDPMGAFKVSLSLEDLQSGPGGRHDNDHQDYRSIKIVPSAAEALCTRPPFLPGLGDSQHLASPEAAVLDRQFRLMREDMVQPLRHSLKALGFATAQDDSGEQAGQASQAITVKPANVPQMLQRNIFPLVAVLGAAPKPRPCIMVAVELPKSHKAARMRNHSERLEYWTEFGFGTLAQDALICLAFTPPGSQQQSIVFGTIARRDPKELAEETPVVGLSLERGADVEQLMQLVGCGRLKNAVLVQVSTSFFSYEPLLKALQSMTTVPLAEEIVHTQEPSNAGHMTPLQIEQAVAARTNLDPTQQQAMRQALESRVGLIQGPPGTGKTFVGALVADTIVQHSSERILVVCYTNHALDQFMEALLDMGITSMIRIGGKSKSTKLEQYNLFRQTFGKFTLAENRRFYTLRESETQCLEKMSKLEELLLFVSSSMKTATPKKEDRSKAKKGRVKARKSDQPEEQKPKTKQKAPPADIAVQLGTREEPEWAIDLWKVLGPFLKAEQDAEGDYAGAWEQLKPEATWQGKLSKWQLWLLGLSEAQNSIMANKSAAAAAEFRCIELQSYLLQLLRSAVAREYTASGEPVLDIWALSQDQRIELAVSWLLALRTRWCQDLAGAMARCKEIQDEIRSLNDSQLRPVLKSARVIGCTATGAAKYKELLQSRSMAPSVVMVEEAGELHESHTLTSLSPSTKQLILIGDHKQLRPKVECYNLSVESRSGHDLNKSLFERLVTGGFPHVTLGVQHRMHPAISSIVRSCTYPQLEDHPRVKEHPPLMGLEAGRRLVFIDHDVPEEQEQGQGWGNQSFKSKVNKHEVQMTVAIVKFLVQQGYRTDQLVVLTPYLGQLLELHKAIREADASLQVALSELDMNELRNAAQPQLAAYGVRGPTSGSGGSIRVSTIDNYQGEEADVVVASLVRCNDQGSVGFLKEPERINVLMSRARNGMILVGSAGTLRNAKSVAAREHWSKVLNLIQKGGGLLQGLPAQCQLHGTPTLLTKPEEFTQRAPEGGCCLPCGVQMPCGHTCPLRCHAWDRDHKRVQCQELVYECCSQGHVNAIQCHAKGGSCVTCVELQQIRENERLALAELQMEESQRRAEDEKQRVMLEAKIERLRQEYSAGQAALSARKEAVRLELEQKRLQAELELQSKVGMDQLAVWEKQQRDEAEVALKQMKADAALEAAAKKDQQHRAALETAQEKEKQLALAAAQLEQLQRESDRKLQDIENKKTRALTKATDELQSAEVKAQATAATFMTMGMWSDALAQAGTGIDGLTRFKQQLQASADSCDVLDLLLQADGIGALLLRYASTVQDGAPATSPGTMGRGLSLIQDGKLLDALQFFNAQADPKGAGAGSGGRTAAQALQALCRAKLGLGQPAAASGKQGHRKQLIDLPMNGSTAEARNTSGDGQEQVHPAQHLADAVFITAKLGVAAKLASPVAASSMRADHAKAAGHALLFLLHPSSSEMPSSLFDEARAILCCSAAVLGGDLRAVAAGSGVGSSGPSGAKQQQQEAWRIRAGKTPSFKRALDLVGLAPVKQALSDLADQVDLDRERKLPVGQKQYNACFYGNPGTGKTTVARIYANVLRELGVLPDSQFVETSGAKLVQGGVNELTKHLTALDKGGVLFVDEAYQLNPKTNPIGAQVLDALLPEMENRRGKLVVVFAGYQKHMEGLMAHNEGLPSRFPLTFTFPDYSDEELHSILKGIMASGARFELEQEKHGRIAAARLGRQRGTVGFGNARAVRNLYERVLERQAARCLSERRQGLDPDLFLITRTDLLGPKFLDVSSCSALADLQAMRGLPNVKQQVDNLLGLIRTNAELEEQGRPLKEVCLNRVLVGNPGTGKTTVASLYGRILKDLGLLSKGDVVVKVPADFTGAVLGESEQKTVAILDAAVGSVLVIDEAYGLFSGKGTSDPYKEAIIDTIVAKVQGVPGDDRCVLLLGYEDQMEAMMRAANPGLQRRFQWQSRWHFEDYTADDLLHIMRGAAKRRYDWDLGEDCLLAGVKVLERERRTPNFGNAGAVNNLLSVVAERMETRLKGLDPHQRALAQPVPDDFDPPKRSDPKDVFKDLIGCKEVLDQLRKWQAVIRQCQKMGKDPLQVVELNFRFVGSPGTGKTTVARRVGMLFESLGLLASSEVLCCSASDFTTGYANQSSGKTRELFNKAVGGVLFIDEAYRLNPKKGGPMMAEVLDEIVQILTEERFMGKMVVILGGYEAEIDELLTINPGLKSRFSQKLFFPDFSCEDACALFKQQLQREYDLALSSAAGAALPGLMQQVVDAPGWSNGRDVITLTKRAFSAFSERTCAAEANGAVQSDGQQEDPNLLSQADVTAAVNDLLSTKQSSFTPAAAAPQADIFQQVMAQSFAQPPPPPQSSTGTRTEAQQAPPTIAVATAPDPPVAVAEPEMEVQADIKDRVWAALEEACGELGYSIDQIAAMLRPGGSYTDELLDLVMRKSGCWNKGEVVAALDAQKPAFLNRVELLIRQREQAKTEMEMRIQQKIQQMGVCCMGYQWLKVQGGWRCAGGAHYLSDAQVQP